MTPITMRWADNITRLLGAAVVATMLPAHGCGAGVAECTLDADCDQGLACELSECLAQCSSETDCSEDEVCLRGLTTERRICKLDEGGQVTNVRTRYAVILDASEPAGCDAPDPGADIAFVLLEDLDGEVVGWGRVVRGDAGPANDGQLNEFQTWAHLDGTRPEAGADSCAPFEADHVVALGCPGFIAVEFLDPEQSQVDARSGEHRLRVGESGEQCEGGTNLDRYQVLLCPGVENMDELPDRCTVSVGIGQGERAFDF